MYRSLGSRATRARQAAIAVRFAVRRAERHCAARLCVRRPLGEKRAARADTSCIALELENVVGQRYGIAERLQNEERTYTPAATSARGRQRNWQRERFVR